MIIPGIQLYETTTNPCYRYNQQITDLPHLHYLGGHQFPGLWVGKMNSEDAKCIQKLCADVTSYYQQQITISSILIVQGQKGWRALGRENSEISYSQLPL